MPNSGAVTSEPNDLRFQFKVIEGLSESIRQQSTATERLATGMADIQRTQVSMLERLAKLEANKFGEALVKAETKVDEMDKRIDALFRDKDRRDGAIGALGALRVWGPAICGVLTVLYLAGRASGVIPSPPTTVTKIETPIAVERRDVAPHALTTSGAAP